MRIQQKKVCKTLQLSKQEYVRNELQIFENGEFETNKETTHDIDQNDI